MKAEHLLAKILTPEQQPFTMNCRDNLFPVIDPQQCILKQLIPLVLR